MNEIRVLYNLIIPRIFSLLQVDPQLLYVIMKWHLGDRTMQPLCPCRP